jgi:hypothetical protein
MFGEITETQTQIRKLHVKQLIAIACIHIYNHTIFIGHYRQTKAHTTSVHKRVCSPCRNNRNLPFTVIHSAEGCEVSGAVMLERSPEDQKEEHVGIL